MVGSMAGNDQARVAAFQRAQAVVDATFVDPANTPVIGDVGYKICYNADAAEACDADFDNGGADFVASLGWADVADTDAVTVVVERLGPLERPAPRGLETSAAWFAAAASAPVASSRCPRRSTSSMMERSTTTKSAL